MAARWFSNFLLNPFVRRVNRRMDMRSVKFCRSTWEVQIFAGSGFPLTVTTSVLMTSAGLYRCSPSRGVPVHFDELGVINAHPETVSENARISSGSDPRVGFGARAGTPGTEKSEHTEIAHYPGSADRQRRRRTGFVERSHVLLRLVAPEGHVRVGGVRFRETGHGLGVPGLLVRRHGPRRGPCAGLVAAGVSLWERMETGARSRIVRRRAGHL